ncbi:MAG: hypothetical protein AAFO91_11135 [Bacteroidota bacterium]
MPAGDFDRLVSKAQQDVARVANRLERAERGMERHRRAVRESTGKLHKLETEQQRLLQKTEIERTRLSRELGRAEEEKKAAEDDMHKLQMELAQAQTQLREYQLAAEQQAKLARKAGNDNTDPRVRRRAA